MTYREKTAHVYARIAGVPRSEARAILRKWRRYVEGRERAGKTAESTAEHLARFKREKSACACGSRGRDCGCKHAKERDASPKKRGGVKPGETRISAKGIPFTVCPRGTKLQALLFPGERYSVSSARAWAKGHGFSIHKVEEMRNFVRVVLLPSKLFTKGSYRLIPLKGAERHGIRGLIGCPRFAILKGGARGVRGERVRKAA